MLLEVRLGEAQNPGSAAHESERRINEAGDSVPGSEDSIT